MMEKLRAWYTNRTPREQRMVAAGSIVLALLLLFGGLLWPLHSAASRALQRSETRRADLDWMRANELDATAIQCWTSLQQNFGVNVCTLMSFMSDKMMPSACEVDITGVLSMYALQLASDQPAALVDWNNNYAGEENKCVLFHCGNWAKSFYPSDVKMATAPILGSTLGVENTYGALDLSLIHI